MRHVFLLLVVSSSILACAPPPRAAAPPRTTPEKEAPKIESFTAKETEEEPEAAPAEEPPQLEPLARVCRHIVVPVVSDGEDNHVKAREQACRKLTGHQGDYGSCRLSVLGNGSATMLSIQTQCGGDSCSFRSWICSAATGERLVPLQHDGGSVEASPDGAFVVSDSGTHLYRTDLATGRGARSAACLSPRLSPGGKWFACRNKNYDVLRFPVNGGKLETVIRSGLRDGEGYFAAYSFGYAPPVTFVSATEIELVVIRADGSDAEKRRAPWKE